MLEIVSEIFGQKSRKNKKYFERLGLDQFKVTRNRGYEEK